MSTPLLILLASFIFFMALRIPLAFTMLLSSSFYMLASGQKLMVVPHRTFTGIDTFTMMAIPFFILASELMVMSGTAEKLLEFANMLVGGLRGGLAYVNVFASMMFGGCSGSAIADVAGLGRLEIAMMTRGGYTLPFSTAITVSSSIQGPLIPPSITMVLIGAVTGTSIGGLLLGGAIPGILVGLSQCLVVFIYGRRPGFPKQSPSYTFRDRVRISIASIPFLLMPLIIVGGIITGWFTPTEAAAVAVFYGAVLTVIYKKGRISLGEIRGVFGRSVVTATSILILSGASNVFGWILTTERVPNLISDAISSLTSEKNMFLLLVNLFLLLFGMVMDSMPAITIIAPILFPIAESLGIDPVHFGVVIGFNLIVGLITPPYGVAIFTGTIVSGLPMEKLIRELIPFIVSSLCILMLVTYVPETVLYIPALFGLDR
jgi:C4-dicarboxylate transporter DctM subunit